MRRHATRNSGLAASYDGRLDRPIRTRLAGPIGHVTCSTRDWGLDTTNALHRWVGRPSARNDRPGSSLRRSVGEARGIAKYGVGDESGQVSVCFLTYGKSYKLQLFPYVKKNFLLSSKVNAQ
jgi:hypothetical protein